MPELNAPTAVPRRPAVTGRARLKTVGVYLLLWLAAYLVFAAVILLLPNSCPGVGDDCDGLTYQNVALFVVAVATLKFGIVGLVVGGGATLSLLQWRRGGALLPGLVGVVVGVAVMVVPAALELANGGMYT